MKKPDIWNCSKKEWDEWENSIEGQNEKNEWIRKSKLKEPQSL